MEINKKEMGINDDGHILGIDDGHILGINDDEHIQVSIDRQLCRTTSNSNPCQSGGVNLF